MPRKPSTEPTEAELRILRVLWKRGPSRLSEICYTLNASGPPVANTSVATILKIMSEKAMVERRSEVRVEWRALLDRDTARAKSLTRLMDRLFEGSASLMVSHLVNNDRISNADRDKIEQLLRDAKPDESK